MSKYRTSDPDDVSSVWTYADWTLYPRHVQHWLFKRRDGAVRRQVLRAPGQWIIGGQLSVWSVVSVVSESVVSVRRQVFRAPGQWVIGGQWSVWSVGQWSLSGQWSVFDDRCSGRTSCNVSVRSLVDSRPCQRDFASYLEASYRCVRGTFPGHFDSEEDDVDLNTIPLDFGDSWSGHTDFTYISMDFGKFRCSHTRCGEDVGKFRWISYANVDRASRLVY